MISKEMEKTINEQIKFEFYSGYVYLAMAAYFDANDLPGFAAWFKAQSQEEYKHAMRFYDYVYERGGKVALEAIDKPKSDYKSLKDIIEMALHHEEAVTRLIYKMVELAREMKDYMTENMLAWFVAEQVEEEANMQTLLNRLERVKDSGNGLIMLDKELGKRKEG